LPGLDADRGVQRLLGRRERYLEMLQRFVAVLSAPDASLRQALAAGDRAVARLEAHAAKGAAAALSAESLAREAARLEDSLRDGERPLAEDAAVQQAWAAVQQALAALQDALVAR
jgi:two-component system sensor histidine kinase/response regulator